MSVSNYKYLFKYIIIGDTGKYSKYLTKISSITVKPLANQIFYRNTPKTFLGQIMK